jgi:hypothetical protein
MDDLKSRLIRSSLDAIIDLRKQRFGVDARPEEMYHFLSP